MKLLYVPDNAVVANLLKDILFQEGVDCQVNGEYLQGGIGELPPLGIVQLMVDEDDFVKASTIITAWESGDYAIQD